MMIPRELGEVVPISIGTAIAIETLINPETYQEGIQQPSVVWLNLRTILRNVHDSIGKSAEYEIDTVMSDLMEEIVIIEKTIEDSVLEDTTKLVPYWNTYKSLATLLPLAKIKEPRTEKQKNYNDLEESVFGALDEYEVDHLVTGDVCLKGKDEDAFVITHIPVDLLSEYNFSKLTLLESHTGSLKHKALWHTKLTGGKKNKRIPFNYFTLQLFGDNAVQLFGWPVHSSQ